MNILYKVRHTASDRLMGIGTNNRISYSVYLKFLSQYLRKPREVGSIGPDSNTCVNGLLKSVQFESARIIIEFGSGSGAVTREILCRKSPESLLICFEKNAAFYKNLRMTILGRDVFIVPDDVFDAAHVLLPASVFRSGAWTVSSRPCPVRPCGSMNCSTRQSSRCLMSRESLSSTCIFLPSSRGSGFGQS